MTRRRYADDALVIDVEVRDDFLRTPALEQRNWLLRRAIDEMRLDLHHLDGLAQSLVQGSARPPIDAEWEFHEGLYSDDELRIGGQQVMQAWEAPLMQAMAEAITEPGGEILEIGFGMGISATAIQRAGAGRHMIIETSPDVASQFDQWRAERPHADVELILARWEDVASTLGLFDGIFFDTYPLSEDEFDRHARCDVTYAAHFFETAARHLRPSGAFTYFTSEINSVARAHQRALLEHFATFTVSVVEPLSPGRDCNYWWAPSMAMVVARSPRV